MLENGIHQKITQNMQIAPLWKSITRDKLPTSRWMYSDLLSIYGKSTDAELVGFYREMILADLYFLLRYGLNRKFVDNDWYFERCREVQSEPDGYLDLWFREGGKSTIITIALTILDILRKPEITVGIFSHTRPIAKSFLRVIKREFESNDVLKTCFPDVLYRDPQADSPKWAEDSGIIVIRTGNPPEATIEAHGIVDGMPTGRHFQLRVYDDVVTRESVSTPEQMHKTLDALDLSDNLGSIGGNVRMIGTRYKLGDAYEEYTKRGVVKPRIYPATDNGRVDGNPVFFTQDEWDRRVQTQSPAIIASQMLQNPLAEDSVIFQADWFNLWPGDKELPAFSSVFLSLDGAISEKTTADFSCILALGLFKATEGSPKFSIMVLDCFMERVSYPDLRDECIRQYQNKFGKKDKNVDGFIIEDKSSGSALIPDLRKAGISVYPYNPGGLDKTARANLVSPLLRDGYVWLPESRNPKRKGLPMNWISEAYEQWCYFPNVKNDDAVDALTQALAKLDKIGYLRGKAIPPQRLSHWQKLYRGTYSGDKVASVPHVD
jgi:predicted phage terminase large subunit-like protein